MEITEEQYDEIDKIIRSAIDRTVHSSVLRSEVERVIREVVPPVIKEVVNGKIDRMRECLSEHIKTEDEFRKGIQVIIDEFEAKRTENEVLERTGQRIVKTGKFVLVIGAVVVMIITTIKAIIRL